MARVALALLAALPVVAPAADPARRAEVARRGADVMPFSLAATVHVFTPTADGGIQRVVVRHAGDAGQVAQIRAHLRALRGQFANGDFSSPTRIHGDEMPGLAALKAAGPGRISIVYRDVDGGAELVYRSGDAALVGALHAWFDAQLSDHGADAMAGHMHRAPAASPR